MKLLILQWTKAHTMISVKEKRIKTITNYNWGSLAWRIYGQLFEAGIAYTDRLSAITNGRRFT